VKQNGCQRHLARSAVDASAAAGTRVEVLAASARVARLAFAVELDLVVDGGGSVSGSVSLCWPLHMSWLVS